MKPRPLPDEHVNRAIQPQLRRLDQTIEILAIGGPNAPPTGTSDPDLLSWLEEHGCILVTGNRGTIPVHLANHLAAGRHTSGILWLRPRTSIRAIIKELYLIWLASTAEEHRDRTLFIPL
jgi:hypothetical protein